MGSPNQPLLGVRRLARAGPLLGAAASTALAHYRMQKNPGPVGEVDRAFRIKHNRQQNRVDQFVYNGAVIGLVASLFFPSAIIVGTCGGLLALQAERIYNPDLSQKGSDYPPWRPLSPYVALLKNKFNNK